ncbi:MAG: dihydrolipoamide dehydrogenase [Actinomycetota bacterium]|jgi:dihydrolipoamide dehydrogenase|nr:dihydrolipoamide dehydrogenase [Actinomycetota bacterium]
MAAEAENFDVVILGAGNAGYAAAFRLHALGLKVAMVERDKAGGTCLHRGCIPTKALLHSAELVDEIKHAGDFGLLVNEPQVDWGKVQGFKDSVVGRMYKGLSGLISRKKIELVQGDGRIVDARTVSVQTAEGERVVRGERALLVAPGSYPRDLPFIKADGDKVQNSNHGLEATDIPDHVIVVGGNYIGLEFASIYRSFGADVDVVEMLPKIAPAEDDDISEGLRKLLERRGIKFHLGVTVAGASTSESGVQVQIEKEGKGETLSGDRMFVAIGRGPRTSDIGLEEIGVEMDRGFIVTDSSFRTNVGGVFAIGDAIVIPEAEWVHPQLAHVAFIEGMKAGERIAGQDPAPVEYRNIPHIIYCQPEVAAVGLSESKAKELGMEVVTKRYAFSANARALMLGGGQGFVKTVAEKDGAVVGVHILGPRASDLITEAQLATSWEAFPSELAELIHPHPTLSEAVGETFLELAGKPLHGA